MGFELPAFTKISRFKFLLLLMYFLARGSKGLTFHKVTNAGVEETDRPDCSSIRAFAFSNDGKYFAYCDGTSVNLYDMLKKDIVFKVDKPRCSKLIFSPLGNVLVVFETYQVTASQPEGTPNLLLVQCPNGDILRSFVHRKADAWCPQWSSDEMLCCRTLTSEVHVYKNNNFQEQHSKVVIKDLQTSALMKCKDTYHLALYVPGNKASPSTVRIFRHNTNGFDTTARPIANKSFFKADSVKLFWNCLGSDLLVLTACDISQESYYGEQGLHYMSAVKDGESCVVPLKKRGPIYCVEWQPVTGKLFVVTHGFMPANTVVYNLKCEAVHEFGQLPRNVTHFNPHGNILCICGFEALKGEIDVYDFNKKVRITQLLAPNSTQFLWAPDGEHFVTATTAPRLRVTNGYRIWHFTGRIIGRHEISVGNNELGGPELHEVLWQPRACPQPPNLLYKTWDGHLIRLLDSNAGDVASANAGGTNEALQLNHAAANQTVRDSAKAQANNVYVPPHLRNRPASSTGGKTESAKGNNKKPKAKPAAAKTDSACGASKKSNSEYDFANYDLTGDPENVKRIKNILKKLQAIEKLKERHDHGDKLEINQLEKIKSEDVLIEELRALNV